MELFKKQNQTIQPDSPKEIEERLRRRYLDRLSQRVKRLRRLLVERNWEELRQECSQLANSGENFGFPNLTFLAEAAQDSIPAGKVPRAATPLRAKETTEALIVAVDGVLMEHTVFRA
jgi:HPt (histidine-containing phosphotransfer) domain-containing protein